MSVSIISPGRTFIGLVSNFPLPCFLSKETRPPYCCEFIDAVVCERFFEGKYFYYAILDIPGISIPGIQAFAEAAEAEYLTQHEAEAQDLFEAAQE